MASYYSSYLARYGVKGMKWGVRKSKWQLRKERKRNLFRYNPSYSKKSRQADSRYLSSDSRRRISQAMDRGQGYKEAKVAEIRRSRRSRTIKGIGSIAGAYLIYDQLLTGGQGRRRHINNAKFAAHIANQIAKYGAMKLAKAINDKRAQKVAREMIPKLGNEVINLKPWQYKVG